MKINFQDFGAHCGCWPQWEKKMMSIWYNIFQQRFDILRSSVSFSFQKTFPLSLWSPWQLLLFVNFIHNTKRPLSPFILRCVFSSGKFFLAFTVSVLTAASVQVFVCLIIARLGLLDGFLLYPFSLLFSVLHFVYNFKNNAFQFAFWISFLIFASHYGFNF